jgi:hypothetical protein
MGPQQLEAGVLLVLERPDLERHTQIAVTAFAISSVDLGFELSRMGILVALLTGTLGTDKATSGSLGMVRVAAGTGDRSMGTDQGKDRVVFRLRESRRAEEMSVVAVQTIPSTRLELSLVNVVVTADALGRRADVAMRHHRFGGHLEAHRNVALLTVDLLVRTQQIESSPPWMVERPDGKGLTADAVAGRTVSALQLFRKLTGMRIRVAELAGVRCPDELAYLFFVGSVAVMAVRFGMSAEESKPLPMSLRVEVRRQESVQLMTVQAGVMAALELAAVDVVVAALASVSLAQVAGRRWIGMTQLIGKAHRVTLFTAQLIVRGIEEETHLRVPGRGHTGDGGVPMLLFDGMAAIAVFLEHRVVRSFVAAGTVVAGNVAEGERMRCGRAVRGRQVVTGTTLKILVRTHEGKVLAVIKVVWG